MAGEFTGPAWLICILAPDRPADQRIRVHAASSVDWWPHAHALDLILGNPTSAPLAGGQLLTPGRLTMEIGGGSGSVNRSLLFLVPSDPPKCATRPVYDRGRCPLYVRAQLETAGLSWTQRDLTTPKATARETGYPQLTGHFRR